MTTTVKVHVKRQLPRHLQAQREASGDRRAGAYEITEEQISK